MPKGMLHMHGGHPMRSDCGSRRYSEGPKILRSVGLSWMTMLGDAPLVSMQSTSWHASCVFRRHPAHGAQGGDQQQACGREHVARDRSVLTGSWPSACAVRGTASAALCVSPWGSGARWHGEPALRQGERGHAHNWVMALRCARCTWKFMVELPGLQPLEPWGRAAGLLARS